MSNVPNDSPSSGWHATWILSNKDNCRPALYEGEPVTWHRWGQQNDGDGDYLAAIIEYPNGEVNVVDANMIIFTDT